MSSTWASGTLSATVGTETFTNSPSAAGDYVFTVDTSALSVNDVLEARVYKKAAAGGTAGVYFYQSWVGTQATDDVVKVSAPVSTPLTEADALRFSLDQTAGTARSFNWMVEKIDG